MALTAAQAGQQAFAGTAPPLHQQERVTAQRVGQQMQHGGGMLAQPAVVRAVAHHVQVVDRLGEQPDAPLGEEQLELLGRRSARQQGAKDRMGGQLLLLHRPPEFLVDGGDADRHLIRPGTGALHPGADLMGTHREVEHPAAAGVHPAPMQSVVVAEGLQHRVEPP